MKKTLWTKALSVLLVLVMVAGMVPETTIAALADGVSETPVTSPAEPYSDDETRARADLDALSAAGLLDDGGKLIDLDIREDGESVELSALAERIENGETVGALTVNGEETVPEQIVKLSQLKDAIEISELPDEIIDISDEERARADLEAMRASGLIDDEGKMVGLVILEDGESVELSALAERIAKGETVGVITVNGEETAPEQIVKLSQMKASLEIAQLLDEEIDISDEHVNNLEALITGIADGSVDIDNAIESGSLSLQSVDDATLSTQELTGETISKSDLPSDGVYNLPSDASDTLHLLTLSSDGNSYVGPYLKGNEYDANHEFPFADTDLAYKEYYYTRPDTYSDRDQNRTPTAEPPLGDYIDWDNAKWGLDGEQTFTLVLPLKSGDTVAQWLANRVKPCSNLANPIEVSVPGYGTLKASYFATFAYCIREQQEDYGSYFYDLGKRRYPLFVAADSAENPVALVACIGVPRNPSALARMDRVSLFMEPSGNYYAISGSKTAYISGYKTDNDYCPEGSVYRINDGDPYFEHPDGTIKKLSNLEDQGAAGYVRYTLIDGCLLFGYHMPRNFGFPLLLDWSEAKTDDCGHFYFDMSIYSSQQLWESYPPRVQDCEYTVASAVLLNKSKFISRQADYTQAESGFIKLTSPENPDFPYVYPGDPEHPENQYDMELLATEDLYQTLAGNGIIYMDKDLDLRFTWQFSDRAPFSDKTVEFSSYSANKALSYELNAAGEVVLTPKSATETRFRIGAVATNNAVSADNGVSYDISFPSVITREGTEPYLMIPTSSQVRETLTDLDTEIFFASNIQTRNRGATTFHAKLYKIEESQIGEGVSEGAAPMEVSGWGEFASSSSNPVTSIKVPGTALTAAGAYAVTISTEFIDGTTVTPFSVTAYLKVKNAPASIKLKPLTSYSAVIGSIPAIGYTVDSKADNVDVRYTIQASGENVGDMTSVSGGTIPFNPVFEGTKKAYTITVYARNNNGDPWSTDSMLLTVYNENPVKLIVKDVPLGEVGGKTGGKADAETGSTEAGESLTMDNSEKISGLIEKLKEDGYSFDDFRADVNLQKIISANYGSGTLGILSDRLQWDAKEGDKTSNALALYHALNGPYADTRNDGFTYYIPTADILMVGTDNTDNKSVTVTATHAGTGVETSVDVTVNTLKDKLYLFRFNPKTTVSLSYTDGDGTKKTVTTNAQGELALYEPKGIASDIHAIASADGEVYVGTIMNRYLTSGEKDVVKLQVYPCNYMTLRPISSQTLTFLMPNGRPYSGTVTLRSGVYANDEYCPSAGIRTVKSSNEQYLREDASVTVTDGKATVYFDPTQFASTNDLRYVFEYRFEDSYLPGYIIVDPASNDPAASIVNLRAISGSSKIPAIIRQDYQQFMDGTTPTAYTRSVIDSTENIGISTRFNKAVLYTEYALLGENVGVGDNIGTNRGYSTYAGVNVVKGALYTAEGNKLTGQTEASGDNLSAKRIEKLSDLNDETTLFIFPFSAVPMLRSIYTMTNDNLTTDGITDEGENPTPTARIKAVFTRGGLTVKSINMPFGVSNLSHQKDLSQQGNGAKEIGTEVRNDLKESTDIGAIFRSINVNDMIRKGFVFLGNLSGKGGDNLINLMILPTQDPATFRIVAFVGANDRSDGDDDDGVSVNFNADDLAEDMSKFQKELEESDKEDSESDGEGSITFNFYGTIILEAHIGIEDGNWDISFRGGNVGTNVKGKYEWGQTFMCGPYPAFISFEVGFNADLEVAFGNKDAVRAMLLDAALGVSIEAFAGLGFDMSLVALQLGIYGKIGADVNFLLLTPNDAAVQTGTKLTISGEIGIKMKVKLLFISYSKNLASTGFNWTKKWENFDQIKQYWNDQGFGTLFGTTASGRKYLMYLFEDGNTMVAIEGDAELESRDYLNLAERVWAGGSTGGMRLMSVSDSSDVQENAYPYSHPAFTDDGEIFLYVSDNDNADALESVTSYAVKNGSGYTNTGRVDSSEDNVLADLDVVAAGTKDKAFAAWVKQVEMPQTEKSVGITQNDLGMMFNATEVYASAYSGGEWSTTRLTDNYIADMSPTVASSGSKAIVAWRSMNASTMSASGSDVQDITAVFDVENNINYSIYSGTAWTEAKVAYNGNAGTVNAIDSAMLSDGTAILVYTVRTGKDVTTTETCYTVIDASGSIVTTGRLTNDSTTDTNAQVTAVNDGEGYFVLGWYSEHDAGEGTTAAEYDADGKVAETKAVVAHDIRLARINKNGSYDIDFPESIGGSADAGSDFRFSAPANNTDIENVSVVWSQRKESDAAADAGKYELNAVRFFKAGSAIGLTAPTDIAETTKNYTIDRFDTYTDGDGAVHAIILGTDYDAIQGISVYDTIDLDAAAGNTVTDNSDSPSHLNILGGEALSSIKLATGSFPTTAADVTCDINISEVIPGFTMPVQFSVRNTGTAVLDTVTATVGSQNKTFSNLNLLPNQSAALLMNYSVPEGAVSDAVYSVTCGSVELGSGTLTLNRPDVGISGMKLLREENGERDIQVMLSNNSEIPLSGSSKTVKLAFYKDPFHGNIIGEEITIPAADYADIDAGIYTTAHTLNVADIVTLVDGEIPEDGVTVYARAWVEDTEEPDIYNNGSFLSFRGLLTRNNGKKLSTDTALEVNANDQGEPTAYTVYADFRNNSMQDQTFNIPAAVLLDSNGEVIAYKNIQDTPLELTKEKQATLTANFTAAEVGEKTPAQAEIRYLYNISFDVNGGTGEFAKVLADINGRITLPESQPTPPTNETNEPKLFFRGWYTSAADGELVTEEYAFTEDSTVYAQYTAHEHVFTYTNEDGGDTVTAVCVSTVADDCPLEDQQRTVTLTIVKPERDGKEAGNPNATIIGATDVLGTPQIRYYKANEDGSAKTGEALSGVPLGIGKYWAEFTLGEGENSASAHVVYELIVDGTGNTELNSSYSVSYDLNGGTGTAPEGGAIYHGVKLTLPGAEGFSKPNLVFDGWNTKDDGTGDYYKEGDSFTVTGETTFYAQWKHVHQWSLAYNSGTHVFTQTCGVPDCPDGTQTLSVTPVDKIYDGKNAQPYICSDGWTEENGMTLPTVTFYSGGEEVSEAKNVGTYTALVSLYNQNINVSAFRITPRPVLVIADDKEMHDGEADPNFTVSYDSVGERLYFENDETYPWMVITEGDRVYAKSGNGGKDSTTSTLTLKLTLEKAGSISFDYKYGTEDGSDYVKFAVDNNNKLWKSGIMDWTSFSCELSAGTHTLKWYYTKDYGVDKNGDFFAVDNVVITTDGAVTQTVPEESPDESVPFDCLIADLRFTNDAAYPWKEATEGDRTYAKSGNGGKDSTTSTLTLKLTLEKAGSISFDYKYGTEKNYDFGYFKLDGNEKLTVTNSGNWQSKSIELPAGEHTLTWEYKKDTSGSSNGDFFAVDNIVITTEGAMMQGDPNHVMTRVLNKYVGGIVDGETLNYTASYEDYGDPDEYPVKVSITVTPGVNPNYDVHTQPGTLTVLESTKPKQTIAAEDVTVTYGDTGKSVTGSVTAPETGGGAISYAVKTGSEDYIDVDASTGELTIKKVPADGKAYVNVKAAKTDAYARTSKDVTVTINPKAMTVAANNTTTGVDGKPHGIAVNVTEPAEGYTVKYGTEEGSYTLDTSPTKSDEGTLTVYYQVTADNYATYTGSATVTLVPHTHNMSYAVGTGENANTIIASCANEDGYCYLEDNKASLTIAAPEGEIIYDGAAHPAVITDEDSIQGEAKILYALKGEDRSYGEATETEPVNAGAYKASITLGSGEGVVTVSVEYEIKNAALSGVSVAQNGTLTYTGSAQNPQITAAATAVNNQAVSFAYSTTEDGEYGDMPSFTDVADAGTVYYKASAPNHDVTSGSFKVTMNKADQAAPAAPTLNGDPRATKITLTAVENCEYRRGNENWQDSPVFTGLSLVTQYTFYQRLKGDDNHNPSPASQAQFTTGSHDHEWGSFSANGATITASCRNSDGGHSGNMSATMTIAAPTLTVYGGSGSAAATVENGIDDIDAPAVVYKNGNTVLNAAPTAAGTYTASITLAAADIGQESDVTASVAYTIEKAELSVTAKPKTITYGDAPANDGVEYSGLVNNESESVLSGTLAYDYSYAQYGDVGNYTITPKGLSSDNYNITFNTGTLTVVQKEVGLDWTGLSFTYDGQSHKPNATASGLVNNDAVVVTVTGEQTNVGSNYTATASALSGDKAGNYKLPAATTQTFAIGKAELSITANEKTITYGDAPTNDGVTYSGFVNGENESVLGGTLAYDYSYAQFGDVSSESNTYTITPKGLTSDNYIITFNTGTLTVLQKEVGLDWTGLSFTYDGQSHKPGATASGLVNNDVIGVTVTGEQTNAGTHSATASSLTGTKAGNYKLPEVYTQSFTINKLEIKGALVKLNDFEYDTTVPTAEIVNDAAVEGANGTIVHGDSTKNVSYYYQATAFLKSQTDDIAALDAAEDTIKVLGPTTFGPGKHYILAVISGDNYTDTYITQSVFEVTQNTEKERTAPEAPAVDGTKVTVAEADRAKSLEYSLDGGKTWLPAELDENGEFSAEWADPVSDAELKLRETSAESYAKPSLSASGTSAITITTFTVTYDANGGIKAPDAVTVNSGRTAAVSGQASMTRKGYSFKAWNTSADGSGTEYKQGDMLESGTTLYAQWEVNTYKVAFSANGGSGTMEELEFTYDTAQALRENAFEREGYVFLGWSTAANGSVQYQDKQSVRNLAESGSVTLYAVWAKDLYNVNGTIKSAHTGDITLELVQGSNDFGEPVAVEYDVANEEVSFTLNGVPAGIYNLIAKQGELTMTVAVVITDEHVALELITMPTGNTSSVVDVRGDDAPSIVVGGLDAAAAAEEIDGRKVTVAIAIDTQNEAEAGEAGESILNESHAQKAEFFDFTVTKTISNKNDLEALETMSETKGLIELIIPFDFSGKNGIRLYRCHDGEVQELKQANGEEAEDGTCKLDQQAGLIYIYTSSFSTYAITYSSRRSGGGGSSGGGSVVIVDLKTTTINETANGTVTIAPENAGSGEMVTITAKPDEGYEVDTVSVTDANGKDISVTRVSDTIYTYTQPAENVTIDVTFKAAVYPEDDTCPKDDTCPLSAFNDLDPAKWYHDGVHFALDKKLMSGYGKGSFKPNDPTNRAMMAQILWNMEGKPSSEAELSYGDLQSGKWYEEAVRWASSKGIMMGYRKTVFAPMDTMTREQLATTLYRYAKFKGVVTASLESGGIAEGDGWLSFSDSANISPWAVEAIEWAVEAGIIAGFKNGSLKPQGEASRAQVATMLMRFTEMMAGQEAAA